MYEERGASMMDKNAYTEKEKKKMGLREIGL